MKMTDELPLSVKNSWLALLVAVTFFMENLDATVITTALPQMSHDLAVSPVALNIGVSAYLLAVAIGIPVSGWLAERFGARTVFGCAILIFTFASGMCGVSDTLLTFTLSRVLQGIGGAMMVPVGRMVVLRVTEKKDMVKTIAFITWPGLIAPVLGPPLGGMIVTYSHWPWIFWLNIPLGVIAFIATCFLVPQFKKEKVRPFDVPGFVLTATACTALIVALEVLGLRHSYLGLSLLMLGMICSVLVYRHSFTTSHALIPFHTLSIATFRNAITGGSMFRASINAVPFLLPLLFQLSFGWSAAQAGAMVLWVFAGNLAMKPATTWLMKRWGFRQLLIANGIISFVTMLGCLLLSPTLDYFTIAAILFIGGLSRSLQFSCYNSLAFADIAQTAMSDASVIFSIFFQFSMSAGIAIAAFSLQMSMEWSNNDSLSQHDVRIAFLAVSGLILLSVLEALKLNKEAGKKILLHTK